ncbi:PREDICTED: fas apoptotic inhibitory molecule 3 isoform X2 [Cercocebus atys]|uniref:fas apoptotic inhibitory molecule 3 isoform X2 n=1 Tax=Cercocebus atys TaxID=9531 RepID=UPI0005F42E2A|nr:PREDICTED: fas apoptotic inhibitory molecule 3 isoform X2 [Cercocebus atys]
MDLWLWSLYFLPVSGALRILPEVKVEGELGGSVTIKCPLPEMHMRMYLCREMVGSGTCGTVVSTTNFIKVEYKGRVTLKQYPRKNLFLVEVTQLTESDSGVYACGAGRNTDRGKTQKVTLNVHSVTTPAQRTKFPPVHHSSPTTQITHHPRVSRASSVVGDEPPTFLPSTTASKISALEKLLKPRTASYNHHTRLHRQRTLDYGSRSGREGQGFHILISTILGLFLLALLGLVVKSAVERRKALSRRARRLAVMMRVLESSQRTRGSPRPRSQNNIYSACPRRARGADAAGKGEAPVPGPGAPLPPAPLQRGCHCLVLPANLVSQAPQIGKLPCELQTHDLEGSRNHHPLFLVVGWWDAVKHLEAVRSGLASLGLLGQQALHRLPEDATGGRKVERASGRVSESPWFHAPSLKSSCEYVSLYHQPAAKMEDNNSDDYINVPA